jgi:tetratricopeptide (TPR) repeat protein
LAVIHAEIRAGRFFEAQLQCRRLLETRPEDAQALHLMASVCLHAGEFDHAVEWASRAIRKQPNPVYLTTLGAALVKLGRSAEAQQVFDKAVSLAPDEAEHWVKFGDALQEMKRPGDAFLAYQRALQLEPDQLQASYQSGVILRDSRQYEEALARFDTCLDIEPDDLQSLHLRAATLKNLDRLEECLADNLRAHGLDPKHPLHCNNVGDVLLWLGRRDEALNWLDKALALKPDDVDALLNKAVWFRQGHRLEEAAALYQQLRTSHPDEARFERDLAYIQLQMGDFAAGWNGREARWRVPGLPIIYPNFSQPMWKGDADIKGKTILVYADEGIGDAIQFARYLPLLAARGARIILLLPESLVALMSGIPGVIACRSFSSKAAPPVFDLFCPLGSLPLAFGTDLATIPSAQYLPPTSADRAQAWESRLGPHDRLRVGLVWSGNPRHGNDRERSIPLRVMARLLDADADFVSLQKDPRPNDSAVLSERKDIVDLTAHLVDFAETAALISCLDLVVTVDTSVAHLAATMGVPTWLLLPHLPDWRWLLGRDDSPWYPAMRLFRQTDARDYASVLDRVRIELADQAALTSSTKPITACHSRSA